MTSSEGHSATSSRSEAPQASSALTAALKGLTEGTQRLVKHHLELARHELRADAVELGKEAAALGAALGMAAIGYLLLNLAVVLCSSWFGGMLAMGLTAMGLALIHLVGGGLIALTLLKRFKTRHYGPHYTGNEIQRSKHWLTEKMTTPAPRSEVEPRLLEEERSSPSEPTLR